MFNFFMNKPSLTLIACPVWCVLVQGWDLPRAQWGT